MAALEIPHIEVSTLGKYGRFREALDKIRETFSQLGHGDEDRRVIVDLFPHGGLAYHISNLLIAKYAAIQTGAQLIGVTCRRPLFIRNHWDGRDVFALADAFGVQDVRFLDDPVQDGDLLSDGVKSALSGTVAEFAECVEVESFGSRYYGFEDRLRRRYLLPELKTPAVPEDWLREEYIFHRAVSENLQALGFSDGDIFICGHLEYDPYKRVALECIQAGGCVIYNWALQPFTLKKFSSVDDLMSLSVPSARDVYEDAFERCSVRPGSFDSLAHLYRASLKRVRPTTIGNKSAGNDADLPRNSVVLMTQALSDAVHSYGPMLFDDFAHWIESSLEFMTRADLDVCLRDHPMQDLYDQTKYVAGLSGRYARDLRFTQSPGAEVLDLAPFRIAVTTQGTPGIELPLDGVRTIAVGTARYSGYGLVDEPTSREEYFRILADETPLSEAETRRRFERAALFGYMELFCFRTTCRLLPRGLRGQPSEILEHLAAMISLEGVFSDPLFSQTGSLVLDGASISINDKAISVISGALASASAVGANGHDRQSWWIAETAGENRGDAADRPRPVALIVSDLKAARSRDDDLSYANAIYRAFWGKAPEQDWLLGAFKCLGRPWGRSRIIRHTFNRWVKENRVSVSWSEFRKDM